MNFDRRTFVQSLGVGALGTLAGAARLSAAPASTPPLPGFDPAHPDAYWRAVRAQYPLQPDPLYLNTGGLGPTPQRVLDEVFATMTAMQQHSEPEHQRIEPARKTLAGFLGADSREVCFTRNATEGNSIIAAGLALQAGDEVIFESHAHPGGSYPWFTQKKQRGVEVRLFEPDPTSAEGNLARIKALVTPRTKVIQVSHLLCTTGQVMPVRAIADFAQANKLWFHVDGAQSVGMIPVDLHALGCDSYAISGHKWLGGPHGSGIFYLRHARLEEVALSGVGSYSGELPYLPGEIAYADATMRHEYGTRSIGLIAGLAEAVRFQEEIGRERIAAYGHGLGLFLAGELARLDGIEVLTPRDPALRGSMTTFRHPRANASQLSVYLQKKKGLRCRSVAEQHLEALRVSTHVFNSAADCERVVAAVKDSLKDL